MSGLGYQKLPSGLILQWGSGGYTGASGSTQLAPYLIAYPNTALSITGTIGAAMGTVYMGFQVANKS